MPESSESEATSTGLDPKLAAPLSYLLGFVTGIAFLVLEKKNAFVRFHAMQSTITFVALFVVRMVVSLLSAPLTTLVTLAGMVLWVFLMVKSFQGERYKLPWVGDLAEQRIGTPPA